MAQFNLADYETVDSRIKRFYSDHAGGRITTELVSSDRDAGKTRWVVKASVWRDRFDGEPDGTGFAFEIDGEGGMANKTAALENAETSAIGRALANIGYSGDKRASREEMSKAANVPAVDPVLRDEWVSALTAARSLAELQEAWEGAGKAGVTSDPTVIKVKDKRKAELQ